MTKEDILNPLNSIKLIGMDSYFEDLLQLHNANKLPRVMLISGEKGLGKFTLINHFLNYIFSKDTYDLKEKKIDKNSEIYRQQINQTSHSIFHLQNDGGKKIKVNDVRNLKSILSKSSINNALRFVVLDDVEQLNESSSNALLKIIEEPSEKNYFILIDNQEKNVIQTIASRCLKIKVFINKTNRSKIIKSLISENKISKILEHDSLDLSPGLFLKYNAICLENEIDNNLDYLGKVEKLLRLYKKSKNKTFIDLSILFTNQYFYNLSLEKKKNILLFNSVKNKIIYYINDFLVYNLNLNSVLNLIHSQLYYAK